MEQRGDEVHTSEVEASGGSKEGVVRWVLLIGTVLAVVLLTIVWTTGALVQDDGADSETSVSNTMQQQAATEAARGEPIAPSMGESAAASASATAQPTTMPGDAPAGDPKPDAQ